MDIIVNIKIYGFECTETHYPRRGGALGIKKKSNIVNNNIIIRVLEFVLETESYKKSDI